MINIENVKVYGLEEAIRGMRNPLNSWAKSDTGVCKGGDDGIGCANCAMEEKCEHSYDYSLQVGKKDHDLMMRLAAAGKPHSKYRRMIIVYLDIVAPLYWWKEFDTYKVGTVANSCSTMHKIAEKEFTLEDFSTEHLLGFDGPHNDEIEIPYVPIGHNDISPLGLYKCGIIPMLNLCREKYLEIDRDIKLEREKALNMNGSEPMVDIKKLKEKQKDIWWQMIQLLPSSYNQRRTIMLNYEVLNAIYYYRKLHKQDEWREFCKWIESLPYSELITCNGDEGK